MNDRNSGEKVRDGDGEQTIELGTDIGGVDDFGSGIETDIAALAERDRQQLDKADRNVRERIETEERNDSSIEVPASQIPSPAAAYGLDCGFAVQSHDEEETISLMKDHAKRFHDIDITDEDVKRMMKA